MSVTITDVTELQAMEDDLTEDYVLGNNIDASATSGWNGGEGFEPIGALGRISNSRPWSDDFGYAGQSGSWTIYPADGVYYDKVNEETSDGNSTYIKATTTGSYCLLSFDATGLNIPIDAYGITVVLRAMVRKDGATTSRMQGMVNINGVEYLIGNNLAVPSQSEYTLMQWTMHTDPSTGDDWTAGSVFALATAGVGVKATDAAPHIFVTQLWILVDYDVKFSGTFDGAGYTISDLYINRPTEDYVGLFGYTDEATIQDVPLTGVDITGVDAVAGLVGWSVGDTIYNCSVSGTISGGDDYIGGLMGVVNGSTTNRCYATAVVSGDDYIGGLLGYVYGTSSTTDCYARGGVTGDSYMGGLIGYISSSTLVNCHSTGAVSGNSSVGGLVGLSSNSTATNCFWDTQTSGTETSDGGTGKTTAEMKTLATFTTWDIGGSGVNRNDGYPFLHWETGGSVPIWQIYKTDTRSYTPPDIFDHKGRPPKNARVRAYRVDTHLLVEEELTDQYGSATFTDLPNDVDVVFQATWGGPRTPRKPIVQG